MLKPLAALSLLLVASCASAGPVPQPVQTVANDTAAVADALAAALNAIQPVVQNCSGKDCPVLQAAYAHAQAYLADVRAGIVALEDVQALQNQLVQLASDVQKAQAATASHVASAPDAGP